MEEYFKVRVINGQSSLNRGAYDRHQEALANRRAEGRYTLEEAALFIGDATGERADELLRKLKDAAHSRALLVYEPGKAARYLYGDDFASRVREFYEEAYWCDLNEWLSDNEPRVLASFPDPNAAPGVSIERSGRANPGSPELTRANGTERAETLTQERSKTGEQPEIVRKRAALIEELQGIWPTIIGDLGDASRSGLSDAANSRHGFWKVRPALQWAFERRRILRPKAETLIRAEGDSELSALLKFMLNEQKI